MLVLGWFGVCSVSISSCWNVNLVLVWCFLQVVSGAGHLRRTPLLSVFDITHYTKNNIIDEGGWGGVGWRGIIASLAIRSHALAHIRHATLLYVLMHLHTYVMLRRCTFSCACTHTSCYDMLRCCTFSCTCTHTSCYAAVRSHALAQIQHATQLYVLMHLHRYVMLRHCTVSGICTHTSCHAAVRSHALAHIRHATLLYVLMMMMMKLFLMLKFRFSAFCGPPVKCFRSDNSGGLLRCPALRFRI